MLFCVLRCCVRYGVESTWLTEEGIHDADINVQYIHTRPTSIRACRDSHPPARALAGCATSIRSGTHPPAPPTAQILAS
jgi:hypothetical protein